MKIDRTKTRLRAGLMGVTAVLVLVVTWQVAQASTTPNSYAGCISKSGDLTNLRIGTEPLKPCSTKKGQQVAVWNQTGPAGIQGTQGIQGPQGPSVAPHVVQVVGSGTSVSDNLGTTSTSFVDLSPQLVATLDVQKDDWVQMQFQANTDREGSNEIFQYFTFSVNGTDVDTGSGAASNRGGIVALYNVDRTDIDNFGTGRVNMTYWWKANQAGQVVVRPRQKTDGAGSGTVYVVNNGDINPILSVVNFGN